MDEKRIKKILIFRNDRFGEFLLNIPVFRALKESFAHARLTVVVNSGVKEIAECADSIDEVIVWDNIRHKFTELLKFSGYIRKRGFDISVMLNPQKEFNIIAFLAGIPVRAGYNHKWSFLLTHRLEDKKYLAGKHEIEYNLDLAGLIGAKTENKTPSLKISDKDKEETIKSFGLEEFKGFIVVHPWTSDPIKQWPIGYFSDLVRRLTEELELNTVIVGRKEGRQEESIDFSTYFPYKLINLTGKTSLKQLAVIIERARLLISCDSGPVHLASSTNTPAIVLFNKGLPGKTSVRWGPISQGSVVIEKNQLAQIMVHEVIAKVKEVLAL